MAVKNGIRLWAFLLTLVIMVGSLSYTIGVKTTRSAPNPELEDRVRNCEEWVARWDERWVFLRDQIVSINEKLDKLNGRFASD